MGGTAENTNRVPHTLYSTQVQHDIVPVLEGDLGVARGLPGVVGLRLGVLDLGAHLRGARAEGGLALGRGGGGGARGGDVRGALLARCLLALGRLGDIRRRRGGARVEVAVGGGEGGEAGLGRVRRRRCGGVGGGDGHSFVVELRIRGAPLSPLPSTAARV